MLIYTVNIYTLPHSSTSDVMHHIDQTHPHIVGLDEAYLAKMQVIFKF